MTPESLAYVKRETMIGAGINAALSAFFTFVAFGGNGAAVGDVAIDALPQSFMIGLMTALVPTAITRSRLRRGVIASAATEKSWLPDNMAVRASVVAVGAAIFGGGLQWLLLPLLTPAEWPFSTILGFKVIYGALLGLLIGPFVLRRALADPVMQNHSIS